MRRPHLALSLNLTPRAPVSTESDPGSDHRTGLTDFSQAAARVSGLELGGLVGSLLAGKLSDRLIGQAKERDARVGEQPARTVAVTVRSQGCTHDGHQVA